MDPKKVVLSNSPSTQGYDMLVFAAPVYGFSLAAVMKAYLQGLPSWRENCWLDLSRRHFRSWMGGEQAINGMEKLVKAKGGE
jgi:NAD(P)H-dependent FMN reductase